MKLGLIYAHSRGGVIGKDGAMPWHLPEDLARLKKLTLGCPVIMGRKTWESIPPRFRPLPGRTNIVLTRQGDWSAAGARRAASLQEALAWCASEPLVWILGGAEIFAQALPLADLVEATEIDAEFDGDTFAPELGSEWKEVSRDSHSSANGLSYAFVTYQNSSRGA